jgi:hypothetical protein
MGARILLWDEIQGEPTQASRQVPIAPGELTPPVTTRAIVVPERVAMSAVNHQFRLAVNGRQSPLARSHRLAFRHPGTAALFGVASPAAAGAVRAAGVKHRVSAARRTRAAALDAARNRDWQETGYRVGSRRSSQKLRQPPGRRGGAGLVSALGRSSGGDA